jgi:hypothetical protein
VFCVLSSSSSSSSSSKREEEQERVSRARARPSHFLALSRRLERGVLTFTRIKSSNRRLSFSFPFLTQRLERGQSHGRFDSKNIGSGKGKSSRK